MVFEKLTLFEFNVEDAQFGPGIIGGEDAGAAADEEGGTEAEAADAESSGGAGRLLRLLAVGLVVSLVAALLARRFFRSDGGGDGGIEIEGDDVGVEQAVEN